MALFTEVRGAKAELVGLLAAVPTLKLVVFFIIGVLRVLLRAQPIHALGAVAGLIWLALNIVVLAIGNAAEIGLFALCAIVELDFLVKVFFGRHLCVGAVW